MAGRDPDRSVSLREASSPPGPAAADAAAHAQPSAQRVAVVLAVGIAAVSTAGTLVRLAPEVHPLALAFWRVLLVAVILAPGFRPVSRRDALLTALGGLFLALHFWSWFLSLRMTTVMRSTLLVCLTPVWAAIFEWAAMGRAPKPRFWLGIAVALAGVGTMVAASAGTPGSAPAAHPGVLAGDGLAVLGGVLGAAYFTVGRSVRARVRITAYGPLSCAATAAWLALLATATGAPLTGFPTANWLPIAALALGPQLLGHVGFNYAVGRLPAAIVAAVILLEPVGATGVAAVALHEMPHRSDILGGLLTLAGVAVAALPAPGGLRRAIAPE